MYNRTNSRHTHGHTIPWHQYMAIPALLLFALFFLYPYRGMHLSLTEWDGFTDPRFIGLRNFTDFADERALPRMYAIPWYLPSAVPAAVSSGLPGALLRRTPPRAHVGSGRGGNLFR